MLTVAKTRPSGRPNGKDVMVTKEEEDCLLSRQSLFSRDVPVFSVYGLVLLQALKL